MPSDLAHYPSPELDSRLLEATREVASRQLNKHHQEKERNPWQIDEILCADELAVLLPHRFDVGLDEGVREAVEVFTLTEDAIVWYAGDVTKIFNPGGLHDDNNPHDVFARDWATEEFLHTIGGREIARLIGSDLVQLEKDRQIVTRKAGVPVPISTAMGIGYTGLQESNTSGPYKSLEQKFRTHALQSAKIGNVLVARICEIAADIYREIGQDERLHRAFITSIGREALHCGDQQLQEYMLSALWGVNVDFAMPVQSSIPRPRRFVAIKNSGIFTRDSVKSNQFHVLNRIYEIDKIQGLQGRAAELQEKLGDFMLSIQPLTPEPSE